jgi:hypothetical protein
MVLRNVRILPEHYTAPQPRGPRPEFSPPQKPQMSQTVHCQNISYARWLLPTWYCYWTATLSTLSSHPVDQCCFFKLLLYTHTQNTYQVWLWSCRNDFIASLIPVYSQPTETGHPSRTPLERLCTSLKETFLELVLWNSFQCHSHIF